MPKSPVRFLDAPDLQQATNDRGENYWCAGWPEIADQMGLTCDPLPRAELSRDALRGVIALILPDLPGGYLADRERDLLDQWVQAGGLLIGLATQGLDDLFGIQTVGGFGQPEDPWSCAATLRLTDPDLARPLYSPDIADVPLLIISPVRVVAGGGTELARLLTLEGEDLGAPAACLREVGQGRTCYFAFNLCQTLWTLHQGRPIHSDRDGDGYLRMSDAIAIRPFRIDVPYADLLLLLLRNVISLAGVPFIHPLPPTPEGLVPDALLFWGGDEEGLGDSQVEASDWMRAHGLPYHINIMPLPDGTFPMSQEGFRRIRQNGHEPSLHFNYIGGREHPYAITELDIRQQFEWYRDAYDETPVCTVFHWCVWNEWSEPAEWMAACGIQADNSRLHCGSPPINPVNLLGYAFGTALPFWYRTDWRSGNRRVDFISQQINAYECGYVPGQGTEFSQLHRALRDAACYHFTLDMFHHPTYLVSYAETREAVLEVLRYIRDGGLEVIHMGNDELNHWWRARARARLEQDGEQVRALVEGEPWRDGYVVVRRSESGTRELGGCWEYVVVAGTTAAGDR